MHHTLKRGRQPCGTAEIDLRYRRLGAVDQKVPGAQGRARDPVARQRIKDRGQQARLDLLADGRGQQR